MYVRCHQNQLHIVGHSIADCNSGVTGAIVSMYDVGCFIGAMSTGSLSDRYGRERMLAIASVVFVIGAVLQAASYTVVQIVNSQPFTIYTIF